MDFNNYRKCKEIASNPIQASNEEESEELLFIDDEDDDMEDQEQDNNGEDVERRHEEMDPMAVFYSNNDAQEKSEERKSKAERKKKKQKEFTRLNLVEDHDIFNKQNITFRDQKITSSSLIKINNSTTPIQKSRAESGYHKRKGKQGPRHTFQLSRRYKDGQPGKYKISLTPNIQKRVVSKDDNDNKFNFRDSSLNSKSQKNKIGSLKSTVAGKTGQNKNPFGYQNKKKSLRNFGLISPIKKQLSGEREREASIKRQIQRANELESKLRKLKKSFENSKIAYEEKISRHKATHAIVKPKGEMKASFYSRKGKNGDNNPNFKWK